MTAAVSTLGVSAAIVVALGLQDGCADAPSPRPLLLANTAPATRPGQRAATASMPAAPQGTVVPNVGMLRRAWYWGKTSDSTWQAIYEVDPQDSRIQRALASARRTGLRLDAGDAGLALYLAQVRAAGGALTDEDATQLSYRIQDGAWQVTVLSDDEHTDRDPNVFILFVDRPGG
jgi:hypothetical protein